MLRSLTNRWRNIRLRSQFGHEVLDLSFGLVSGSGQDVLVVGVVEVLGQHPEPAQVNAPILEHVPIPRRRAFEIVIRLRCFHFVHKV